MTFSKFLVTRLYIISFIIRELFEKFQAVSEKIMFLQKPRFLLQRSRHLGKYI